MLYSQTDRDAVLAMRTKRRLVVWIPTALILGLAIASFVWYRLQHDVNGWIPTGLLTIAGGAYCIFFYGVYLRPVKKYKQHLDYMLTGRMRTTEGVLKEIADVSIDHDGLDCFSVVLSVDNPDNPEDDRQFYLDAFKSLDGFQAGNRVRIESNDRMIASVAMLTEETE